MRSGNKHDREIVQATEMHIADDQAAVTLIRVPGLGRSRYESKPRIHLLTPGFETLKGQIC